MRIPTLALAAAVSLTSIPAADAVVRGSGEPSVVTAGRAQRARRTLTTASADRMAAAGLAGWTAQLDRDTDVPIRLWGHGAAIPGAVASATIAEAAARVFLEQHLALLAPGASPSDFVVVANRLSSTTGIRSVGFEQRAGGARVVGGSIGFAFQNDRMALVSSTALPNVQLPRIATTVSRAAAFTSAQRWLSRAGFSVRARSSLAAEPTVIVPVIRTRTARGLDITYKVAHELSIEDLAKHERWNVWVDAATGSPIARQTTIARGTGKVMYEVPARGPQGTRTPFPAGNATFLAGTSALDGTLSFTGAGPVTVAASVAGPLVSVADAQGIGFVQSKPLADGGTVTFAAPTAELDDAQLAAFIHANTVKQFAKRLDPDLAYLDQTLSVSVNEEDVCNAFSTGDDIHFFKAGTLDQFQCENTGRIADVVYHEFGHSWHSNTLVPGVGQFHPSVSEGLADFTSVLITGDQGLARGFFVDKPNDPLRDLDPVGIEKRFPDNADGEPHDEGEIIGEALFDLKTALAAKYDAATARAKIEKIFLTIMQRSVDLPSTYAEALLGDDDDGDLANGVPDRCEIDAAFGIHGLGDPSFTLGIQDPVRTGFQITTSVIPPVTACAAPPSVTGVTVDWNVRGADVQHVELAKSGNEFSGAIPTQPDGTVVQYKVVYTLSTGSTVTFPSGNPADPTLEFYVGNVRTIACFDFEAGAQGWTGSDAEWKAGTPLGLGGDPAVAHGGNGVLGLDLDEDGLYLPDTTTFVESPEIDLAGATNARLQYHRWLGVEDGNFDQAQILVNDQVAWTNAMAVEGDLSLKNHTDHEWRFNDLDLAGLATGGKVKLKFQLTSDGFSELGGWTLDDVCIVAPVAAGCGNSVVDPGEACDDGNTSDGDGCSATCQTEDTAPEPDDGGCCSSSGSPVAPAGLGLALGALLLRRRRR